MFPGIGGGGGSGSIPSASSRLSKPTKVSTVLVSVTLVTSTLSASGPETVGDGVDRAGFFLPVQILTTMHIITIRIIAAMGIITDAHMSIMSAREADGSVENRNRIFDDENELSGMPSRWVDRILRCSLGGEI